MFLTDGDQAGKFAFEGSGTASLVGFEGITWTGTLGGRVSDRAPAAVEAYMAVAQKHGLDLVHMSLAWCMQRPFMMSAIFGATNVDQLAHIIAGKDLVLSPEVMKDIDAAHRAHPMPY